MAVNPRQTAAPASGGMAITKSDTVDFAKGECRGIYVGGAGDVNVVFRDGSVAVFSSVPAGSILPVFATRVNSASTSATVMLALY